MNSVTPENLVAAAQKLKEEKAKFEAKKRKKKEVQKRKLERKFNKIAGIKQVKLDIEPKKNNQNVKSSKMLLEQKLFKTSSMNILKSPHKITNKSSLIGPISRNIKENVEVLPIKLNSSKIPMQTIKTYMSSACCETYQVRNSEKKLFNVHSNDRLRSKHFYSMNEAFSFNDISEKIPLCQNEEISYPLIYDTNKKQNVSVKFQKPLAPKPSLRVLSLYNGLGVGILALRNNGFIVEKYYSSEIDENCIKILKKNHSEITHLGNVKKLEIENLSKLGINLVIGGNPYKNLEIESPKTKAGNCRKKEISDASSTGYLFFEFPKILNILEPVCFKGQHKCSSPSGSCDTCEETPFYWMYESVQSMEKSIRDTISRHLNCEPIEVDAKTISPASRKRLFWSNIPGISTYTLKYRKGEPSCIKDCLIKERKFNCKHKLDTMTTRKDSIIIHEHVSGHEHTKDCSLYSEEMERVTGMPRKFTEIKGLATGTRNKIITKTSSVYCLTELLNLLNVNFKTEQDI